VDGIASVFADLFAVERWPEAILTFLETTDVGRKARGEVMALRRGLMNRWKWKWKRSWWREGKMAVVFCGRMSTGPVGPKGELHARLADNTGWCFCWRSTSS